MMVMDRNALKLDIAQAFRGALFARKQIAHSRLICNIHMNRAPRDDADETVQTFPQSRLLADIAWNFHDASQPLCVCVIYSINMAAREATIFRSSI